jgi:4-carboxymuconolactone decarboxylase
MARIPAVNRDNINPDLVDVFDLLALDFEGVGTGPMSILKHSPEMARRATPLFEYVRNESSVPIRMRELAILVTARAMDCPYIWNRHVSIARDTGLDSELLDALRDRIPLPKTSREETLIINYCSEILHAKRVQPDTFEEALAFLGRQGLVELNTLIGFYTMLAFNANAVELDLPDDINEVPLPTGY